MEANPSFLYAPPPLSRIDAKVNLIGHLGFRLVGVSPEYKECILGACPALAKNTPGLADARGRCTW